MKYMSKHCPKYGCIVIYADCLECEDKICKRRKIENGNNNQKVGRKQKCKFEYRNRKHFRRTSGGCGDIGK